MPVSCRFLPSPPPLHRRHTALHPAMSPLRRCTATQMVHNAKITTSECTHTAPHTHFDCNSFGTSIRRAPSDSDDAAAIRLSLAHGQYDNSASPEWRSTPAVSSNLRRAWTSAPRHHGFVCKLIEHFLCHQIRKTNADDSDDRFRQHPALRRWSIAFRAAILHSTSCKLTCVASIQFDPKPTDDAPCKRLVFQLLLTAGTCI